MSLSIRGVAVVTGGVRLFDGLDLTVDADERVAIVAPSGTGKSVLARLAIGLLAPLAGEITLFGEPLSGRSPDDARRLRARCGVVLQGGSLIGSLSVEDNLWLALAVPAAARARLRRKLDRALLMLRLEHVAASFVQDLSTGERRRAELARALMRDPGLVILDEPLEGAHADAALIEGVIAREVEGPGRALLLLTQDAELAARRCGRVLHLTRGRLVQQGAREAVGVPLAAS